MKKKPDAKLEIKIELLRRGVTQSDIARSINVVVSSVNDVITGRRSSPRIRQAIASAIGRTVAEIWPDTGKKIPRPPSD